MNSVRFIDIDDGREHFRFWNRVYLVVPYDDPKYRSSSSKLRVGDRLLALYLNSDNAYSTVYYPIDIRQCPSKRNGQRLVYRFLDEPVDQRIRINDNKTSIQTRSGLLDVPVVIQRVCAEGTDAQKKALKKWRKFERQKQRQHSESKTKTKVPPKSAVKSNGKTSKIGDRKINDNKTKKMVKRKSNKIKIPRRRKFSASSASSNSASNSIPNSPKTIPSIQMRNGVSSKTPNGLGSNGLNINISNGVHLINPVNPRKRGYDAISQSHPQIHPQSHSESHSQPHPPPIPAATVQPPKKRRRSSRRNAQKLIIPISPVPTSNGNVRTAPLSLPPPPSQSRSQSLNEHPKTVQKVKTKKRIKLKVSTKSNKSNIKKKSISKTPSVALMESVTFKHLQSKYPQHLVVAATKMFGDETYRAEVYCQQRMKDESIPNLPVVPRILPQPKQQAVVVVPRPPSQLRRLWGKYEVEVPKALDDMGKITMKEYLDDFMKNIFDSVHQQKCEDKKSDGFVSGLGIKHQWTEPQEIGEITVGPYVMDIATQTD